LAKIKEIAAALEIFAPLPLQEGYDNAGLQIGVTEAEVTGVLLCLDVTEEVVDEAIASECNLIVSHHPLIFHGLKKITGRNYVERCILKALGNNIAIYSAHTNLDNAPGGVNFKIAEKLGLKNVRILAPKENSLLKLAVYVPVEHADAVRGALFEAGCGSIGDYDSCSYNITGEGTFRAGDNCSPYCGEIGRLHTEKEIRIETVLPAYIKSRAIKAMLAVHPYEEPAYDIYPLQNEWPTTGTGIIGETESPIDAKEFLLKIKDTFKVEFLLKIKDTFKVERLMHTVTGDKKISKVALCGGSGSSFAGNAAAAGADIYITGEGHYHDMFNYDCSMIMAVIGHYESEQYTTELLSEILSERFPKLRLKITEKRTNPVYYL
jgi:dinuclear metal center YbgI/SA1388 family protein